MSLITCPECKKEVSNMAKACPHCGFPISEIDTLVLKKTTLSPSSLWEGKGYELFDKGDKRIRGTKRYSYIDLMRTINISEALAVFNVLDDMPMDIQNNLSPESRAEGIVIDDQNVEEYEELIRIQNELNNYQQNMKGANDNLFEIKGYSGKLSVWDIGYVEKAYVESWQYDNEEYEIKKDRLERHIHTLEGSIDLKRAASMMMFSPGKRPMSTSSSTLVGGVVAGVPGAIYGAARGQEKQQEYDHFATSYNNQKTGYELQISDLEREIRETQEQLYSLERPKYKSEKEIVIIGLRTMLGIIPLQFEADSKLDIFFDGRLIKPKDMDKIARTSKLERKYRQLQLAQYREENKLSFIKYEPMVLKQLSDDDSYKDYMRRIGTVID